MSTKPGFLILKKKGNFENLFFIFNFCSNSIITNQAEKWRDLLTFLKLNDYQIKAKKKYIVNLRIIEYLNC